MRRPLAQHLRWTHLLLFVFVFFTGQAAVQAATVYGVTTSNQLVRFDTATPGTVTTIGAISGLQGGENVLGIDFRPATGQLFALGSTSRLYTINTANGAATHIAPLSTPLSGTDFGFDFNPTVDRIRIVSNTGQNLRVVPDTGAVTVDGVLNPGTPSVTAAAYTNSFNGATATTLYVIDNSTSPDTLFIQNPPNNGTLSTPVPLGVDATGVNGFDITTATGIAYAALTVGGVQNFYTVNLTTGAATPVGAVGGGVSLRGIAVEIGALTGFQVYGVTTGNSLVRFNSARPGTLLSTVAITGLQGGESVLGIDVRPATGQLFALGSTSRLYVINPLTGAATQVGTAGAFTLSGTDFGFDFNPTVDRIRVVSNTGQNLRLNPNDGTLTATDGTLNPGTPTVTAAAYTNNFPNTGGATTLYDIDSGTDRLLIQNPPNNGTLVDVGALGVNTTNNTGFDILGGTNTALAAFQVQGETTSKLFNINLATGSAAFVAPIGGTEAIRDIAIGVNSGNFAVDFDGDRRTDLAVFRPSNNSWLALRSSNNAFIAQPWGNFATDILTPGDYDGDGRTDFAVFRNGSHFVLRSSDNTFFAFQFGQADDQPVVRDYDGDGRTDFAVVRRGGGLMNWFIAQSATGYSFRGVQFGVDTDNPAPGDFDGDGRSDIAVQRGTGGNPAMFFLLQSTLGFRAQEFGIGGDIYVPGDYDGDGKSDINVVRQGTTYSWFTLLSSNGNFRAVQWGAKPHFTAQGDYDGDGRTDVGVWNPINATFFVLRSNNNSVLQAQFGQSDDVPVASYDSY